MKKTLKMNNTKNLNLVKLLIILTMIISGVWYINKASNEKFDTTPNTTIANILPPITEEINKGYNIINDNRFATLDNQIRLDKLSNRVNKLLENIQQSYKLIDKPALNPITFY